MPESDRTIHAAAGEHLVLGELLKRHIEAYLAQGPTQRGWDIYVPESWGRTSVQVKAIDWPDSTPVNVSSPLRFDVMVVVLLQRGCARSRFLVLTAEEVECHLATPKADRKGTQRTMTIPKNLCGFECYEDRWEKLQPGAA